MAAKTTSLYHCSFNQGTLGHFCDIVLLCICQIVEASEDNAAVRRHDLKQVCPRSNNCNYSIGIRDLAPPFKGFTAAQRSGRLYLFVSGFLSSTKTMTTCKSWVGDQNHSPATSWNNMATCNICIVQPKWHSFHRKWPGHLHRVHRYPGKHANVPNRPNRSLRVQLVNHRSLKGINNNEIIFEIWIDMGLFRNIWTGRIWIFELIFGAGSSGDGRLLSTMRNQSRPAGKWQSWAWGMLCEDIRQL